MRRKASRAGGFLAATGVVAWALTPGRAMAESLEQAWQLALQHDQSLAAATADSESARASERAARGTRWPSLGASAGYTQFGTAPQFRFSDGSFSVQAPIFPGDDFVSGGVQMTLPLYTGGRTSASIRAARQATRGAVDAEQATRSALKLDIAQTYVGVLRAQRLLSTANSSVTSLAAHSSDVERQVERELVPRSDLLAAQVALANAEQQRVRADNAVTLAYAAYNRRLGEAMDRTPQLEPQVPVDAGLAAAPVEGLIARALEARPEISAVAAHADALAQQSAAERAQQLPQLALTGRYAYVDNEILDRKDFTMVGVGVTWSLFDGGQARNRSAALRQASTAARHRLDDLRSQVALEVRQAWLGVREARARAAASRQAVAQAEENLRITRELYGTGLGTNTQVLDAVALQVAAASNHDNATLDESLAQIALARAVGAL